MRHLLPTAFLALSLLIAGAAQAQAPVTTDAGRLAGFEADGVEEFLGVPFAAPPVGPLRWKPPAPVAAWTGERRADQMARPCSAPAGGDGPRIVNEDCLYLNVYRPLATRPTAKLPIMVFLHGGGHTQGSPNIYDGARMAQVGRAIVVVPAFRLGVFGALALPDEGQDGGGYTMQDQIAALKWVQKNAGALGGDPRDVTVFGQSAGGYDVCALLASPTAQGLFRAAIMQSGSCDGRPALAAAQQRAAGLGAVVGCAADALSACLRDLPADRLLDAAKDFGATPYGNTVLPLDPPRAIVAGQFNQVPVLIGFTSHEMWPFEHALYPLSEAGYQDQLRARFGPDAAAVARTYPSNVYPHTEYALGAALGDDHFVCPAFTAAQALAQRVPVSMYEFDDASTPPFRSLGPPQPIPPGYAYGAGHTAELQFLMGYKSAMSPLTAAQRARADTLVRYWVGFARGGPWPSVSEGRMIRFTETGASQTPLEAVYGGHHCDLWNPGG